MLYVDLEALINRAIEVEDFDELKRVLDQTRRVVELAPGDAPHNRHARLEIYIQTVRFPDKTTRDEIVLYVYADTRVGVFDARFMTTAQIAQVNAARDTFEQWQSGKIDELPADMMTADAWAKVDAEREQAAHVSRQEAAAIAIEAARVEAERTKSDRD